MIVYWDRVADFWNFVYERHQIWHRRFVQKLPPPWTNDAILHNYFFTNVYRELDPGTQWYMKNVIDPHIQRNPDIDLVYNTLIYRLFCKEKTYEAIGFTPWGKWHWQPVSELLKTRRDKLGIRPFTSAFTVTGNRFGGFDDKIDNICWLIDTLQDYMPDYLEAIQLSRKDIGMEGVFNATHHLPGFGPFLAYEITVDLNYWLTHYSEDDFVNAGPGCKAGIDYMIVDRQGKSYVDVLNILRKKQKKFFKRYGLEDFPYFNNQELSLRNIEHSCCEFSKYMRVKVGQLSNGMDTRTTTRRFDIKERIHS